MSPWYERYFCADYWAYAAAEYTPERTAAEVAYLAAVLGAPARIQRAERGSGGRESTFSPLNAGGARRRVLDVGCGLGRHAVALAGLGFEVTGVDVSAWALERAGEAALAAGVELPLHRLDALTATGWPVSEVDAVVCVQAFGWGTDAEQLRLLRALRGLLVPGGILVLDHSNVSAILRMYAARSVATAGGHAFEFERRYDPLTGRSGGVVRVRRPDGSTTELPDDVRLYQPPEVAALLSEAGFEVVRADADFVAGSAVTMDTRYVQFVARAPTIGVGPGPRWPVSALAGHAAAAAPPAGELDLRSAPDEVYFVANPLAAAWRTVAGAGAATAAGAAGAPAAGAAAGAAAAATPAAATNVASGALSATNGTFAADGPAGLLHRARRYDLDDPYGGTRCCGPLSRHFGVDLEPEQVTAGAGATGLLHAMAALATGGTVLVDVLGHPEPALAAMALGATPLAVALSNPDAAMQAAGAARPALIVLDRPGVAGRVWPLPDVLALAGAAADAGGTLLVDETCACYLPPAESAISLVGSAPGLIVVRSMSKGYCCGGLRVGFAVSSPGLAGRVRAVCPPLAAGALALDVALALLDQRDALDGLRARIAEVKPAFVALLAAAGLDADPGDPRLPWVTIAAEPTPAASGSAGGAGAGGVRRRLASLGIAGKPVPAAPGGPLLVRLSVPLSDERWHAARAGLGRVRAAAPAGRGGSPDLGMGRNLRDSPDRGRR